jgi:hypothetical protein
MPTGSENICLSVKSGSAHGPNDEIDPLATSAADLPLTHDEAVDQQYVERWFAK